MFEIVIITISFFPRRLVMRSIDVLTINGEPENDLDLVKIAEDAKHYFPSATWDDVRYIGKLSLEPDIKIMTSGESFGAFLYEKLTKKIRRIRESHRLISLLLGITPDPVVAMYHFFDKRSFKRTLFVVHDYVSKNVGVVSLFRVNQESSSKMVAHGLGHSKGLRHHKEPIDLMYSGLLRTPTLQVEGFCEVCLSKLTRESD
jgi:predicted Zn-dependent protease